MKKTIISIGLIAIIILGIFLAGCKESNEMTESNEESKIGIAYLGPLTGPLAGSIGIPHMNGLKVAEETKESNIEIFYEDDQADTKNSVSITYNLMSTKENLKFLISPLSSVSFALAPIAESNNRIMFSTGANPKIPEINENTFRFFLKTSEEGKALAEFAEKNLEIEKIGILYQNDEFGMAEKDAFKQEFSKRGIETLIEEAYTSGDKDVKTQVDKILSKEPDAIILTGFNIGIATGLKDILEKNYEGILMGGLNTGYLSDDTKIYSEGVYFTDFKFDKENPKVNEFITTYKKLFEVDEVYANSAIEYCVFEIIQQTTQKCGEDIECIKNDLMTSEFETLLGKVKLGEERDAVIPVVVKYIENGKREDVE